MDTSVIINISATGVSERILAAIPNPCLVVNLVMEELSRGGEKGHSDILQLRKWIEGGQMSVFDATVTSLSTFEDLVSGSSIDSLDDGEAATIACAHDTGGIAVIDEQKAFRICEERHPTLGLASTVDILALAEVQKELGKRNLSEAIYSALVHARMSVMPYHVDWVVSMIGQKRAMNCSSLPRSIRSDAS